MKGQRIHSSSFLAVYWEHFQADGEISPLPTVHLPPQPVKDATACPGVSNWSEMISGTNQVLALTFTC